MIFSRYWRWKRRARKAIAEGRTEVCAVCHDPIVPSDFLARGQNAGGFLVFVHAGFHYTLGTKDAFCETGAVGTGFWDGEQFVPVGESLAAKALRTGEPQVM